MFERNDATDRFVIDAIGRDDEAITIGLRWLLGWAAEHDQPASISVAALDNLRRLDNILGARSVTALASGNPVQVATVSLQVMTDRRMPYSFDGPILAVWANDKRLRKLDELGAAAICAIPWSEGNLDEWKATWGPPDLRTGNQVAASTVGNPIVEAALRSLSATVNLSTGLSHPDDRDAAVSTFRALRDGGELYNAGEIRAWASRNGWLARDADELAKVAGDIAAGKRLRGGHTLRDDALERWRAEAAGA